MIEPRFGTILTEATRWGELLGRRVRETFDLGVNVSGYGLNVDEGLHCFGYWP